MSILPYAHALVARGDIPIPAWLFAWGAAIVLIVSFFAISALWRRPQFEDDQWRPLGARVSRLLLGRPTQVLCGLVGVFLLCVGIYAGLRGTDAPDRNVALTFFFVTAWLGFPFVSVVLGDLFRAFNPWRATGRAVGALFEAVAHKPPRHLAYPERLGRWPAVLGLVAFVWMELIYAQSGGVAVGVSPDSVASAALIYSAYTGLMMMLFGVEKWCQRGEIFSVYFGMFSQLGVFEARDGQLGRRRAFAAAGKWATVPGSVALVVASIGTTTFDGAAEGALQGPLVSTQDALANLGMSITSAVRLGDTILMLGCILAVGLIYLIGVRGMRGIEGAPSFARLRTGFVHSLIPIAFAYLLAHYVSLFVFQEQAQFTYLLSDPLGTGTTDLFGTAAYGVDYSVLSANTVWYLQVGALVVGHVLGLVLSHDRAIAYWSDSALASRSQYWMLAVMVVFTCLGLFLLSVANE